MMYAGLICHILIEFNLNSHDDISKKKVIKCTVNLVWLFRQPARLVYNAATNTAFVSQNYNCLRVQI